MPEDAFDNKIVRVELTWKAPDELTAAFNRAAGPKDGTKEGAELLSGYNAAGNLVARISGGTGMKLMTTTGWQDGKEGARLAEEIRLLRKAISPVGRFYQN